MPQATDEPRKAREEPMDFKTHDLFIYSQVLVKNERIVKTTMKEIRSASKKKFHSF